MGVRGSSYMNIKAEILFNRALLWVALMHLTESRAASACFAICAVLNIWKSFKEWAGEDA